MKKTRILLALASVALLAAPTTSIAQFYAFGKNKVQYDTFHWKSLKGAHVEVFYYPEEEALARTAIVLAEESYADLAKKFQHEVPKSVPLIVFSSHHHFEQNNVSSFYVPEGVQGFTEFMKGRVVLPYTGSYGEFRHVIHHEMVHVFQFSLLAEVYKTHRRSNLLVPPLWFSEGLAEYWSNEWDAQGNMVVADMVLEGKLPAMHDLWQYDGTFTVYKLGQSLCEFIGRNYGDDALRRLYAELYKDDDFEGLIRQVTGVSARRISDDWQYELKRRYFPTVKDRVSLNIAAEERATSQGVNLKPVAVPDTTILGGWRYLFVSARRGYTNIYSANYRGRERDVKQLVSGQRTAQFESFHPFQSRIGVSKKGEMAFVSKWNGRDALFTMDLATRKILLREHMDGLIGLTSPAWSPDGTKIAFSGQTNDGQIDLFLFDVASHELTRLTNDRYTDNDASWSPDGTRLVFASDRTRYGEEGRYNLFLLDLPTLDVRYLTYGKWTDQTPSWSPDGSRIAFASDRDGSWALYTVDAEGAGSRVCRMLGTALDPAWTPDGRSLLFTGFRRGGFGIYQLPVNGAAADSFTLALEDSAGPPQWEWGTTLARSSEAPEPYEPRYALDLVSGGVSYNPNENVGQGVQGAVSDLLGNRQFIFQIGNTAQNTGDIFTHMNVGGWFVNRQNRWNYSTGVFHLAGDYQDALGYDYFERRAGGSIGASYPFSRFDRIEGTMMAYYDWKDEGFGYPRQGFLTTHSISLIHDNTLWFGTGPRDGSRHNLTAALTTNWNTGRAENLTLLADFRRYARVSQWTTLAMRLQGRYSNGDDPLRFVMGGTHSLRGYYRRSIYGTRTYLANMEYRFPLLHQVVLGVPFDGMALPSIEGAVFIDAGNAWEKWESTPAPIGSLGFSFRTNLGGYAVLRYDMARRTDFRAVEPVWHQEFYVGFDF
ncbi:MAG TPA: BamA/TamA family outer membrane protein [Candidatus Eisenbacteria bacterium]|nr:BamA/TamA family outer membrane protein [Candidatus Eisenbacteria bacterium]